MNQETGFIEKIESKSSEKNVMSRLKIVSSFSNSSRFGNSGGPSTKTIFAGSDTSCCNGSGEKQVHKRTPRYGEERDFICFDLTTFEYISKIVLLGCFFLYYRYDFQADRKISE